MGRDIESHAEACLFETEMGYEILDAMVQANVAPSSIPLDELKRIVIQFSVQRTRRSSISPKFPEHAEIHR